jgi:hypothetical protein
MRRAALLSILVFGSACAGTGIRFPFSSLHAHAVHRFFPDLEQRENAVRYARWNALESAWRHGVTAERDRATAAAFRETIHRLPDFPPDPRLGAPLVARDLPGVFGALVAAERFEIDVADALAASDATPETNSSRVEKALARYRRSRFALASPPSREMDARLGEYATARMLLEGDWLFAHAAEDLAGSTWRDQRWRVRATVDRYDRDVESPPASIEASWYRTFAPTFTKEYEPATELIDRATRFRIEVFAALGAADPAARRTAAEAVARRYGLVR